MQCFSPFFWVQDVPKKVPKTDKGIEKRLAPASLVFAQLIDFVPSFHFYQNPYLFSELLLSVTCRML